MISDYKKAKENMLTSQTLECQHFFAQNGYPLELGYCRILSDDLESAKDLFKLVKNSDIRAAWALFMISLIEGNVVEYPTYFQIRNFLEIDLNILLTHFKGNYIENIVRYADFMYKINPEVHKFIGRVLYNNGYKEQAMFFLNRAKNYFFTDPELHYLIAYINYIDKNYQDAQNSLSECLHILPKYFPAVNLSEKILQINGKK